MVAELKVGVDFVVRFSVWVSSVEARAGLTVRRPESAARASIRRGSGCAPPPPPPRRPFAPWEPAASRHGGGRASPLLRAPLGPLGGGARPRSSSPGRAPRRGASAAPETAPGAHAPARTAARGTPAPRAVRPLRSRYRPLRRASSPRREARGAPAASAPVDASEAQAANAASSALGPLSLAPASTPTPEPAPAAGGARRPGGGLVARRSLRELSSRAAAVDGYAPSGRARRMAGRRTERGLRRRAETGDEEGGAFLGREFVVFALGLPGGRRHLRDLRDVLERIPSGGCAPRTGGRPDGHLQV